MRARRIVYTKNSTLGVRRPATAFALYLRSVAGSLSAYKKRRLHAKSPIWRMDLLKHKFACLPAADRKQLYDDAAAALTSARTSRDAALRVDGSQVVPSAAAGAAVAQPAPPHAAMAAQPASPHAAVAAQPAAAQPAAPHVAVSAGTCHVWMQVEVPLDAPEPVAACASPSEPVRAHAQCRMTWPALGGVEHALESVQCGAVGRGSYGACMIVRNPSTGETMVAKVATGNTQRARVCVSKQLCGRSTRHCAA